MINYFKLYEESYLVNGKEQWAIYNVLTGDIFYIQQKEGEFLNVTENNCTIDEACKLTGMSLEAASNLCDKLKSVSLGNYFNTPSTSEKIELIPKWVENIFFRLPPKLEKACISLSSLCNESCSHCNSHHKINKYRCISCNGDEKQSNIQFMDYSSVTKILDNLKIFGCNSIYIKGGDLFLNWEYLKDVLDYCVNIEMKNITINCVSEVTDKNILEFLKKNRISLILQKSIELENNKELIVKELSEELNKYNGLNTHLFLISNYENKEGIIEICKSMAQLGYTNIMVDFIVSNNKSKMLAGYIDDLNIVPRTSIQDISLKTKYNYCLYGNIYIDLKGDIYPCQGLRDFKLGSIENFSMALAEDNINQFWKLGKDKISKCETCELRNACNDCRGLEYSITGDLFSMETCNR